MLVNESESTNCRTRKALPYIFRCAFGFIDVFQISGNIGDKMGSSIVIVLLSLIPFYGLFVLGIDIESEHILTVCDTDNILHTRKGESIPNRSSTAFPLENRSSVRLGMMRPVGRKKRNSKWRNGRQSGGRCRWRRYSQVNR